MSLLDIDLHDESPSLPVRDDLTQITPFIKWLTSSVAWKNWLKMSPGFPWCIPGWCEKGFTYRGLVTRYGVVHWNQKVVILPTFSSLAIPEVVIMTTSGAASGVKVVNMTNFNVSLSQHWLTLKRLGHFFQNVISFSDAVHLICNIFYMKLVQYNECLISIVDADGLVR